jgi:hypothetical protein
MEIWTTITQPVFNYGQNKYTNVIYTLQDRI